MYFTDEESMQTKSFLKIRLLCVSFKKFVSINEDRDQLQTSKCSTVIGRGHRFYIYRVKFLKVNLQQTNFQKLVCLRSLSPL